MPAGLDIKTFLQQGMSGNLGGQLKAALNAAWLMMDRVIRLGVGLFVGVWIARYLGPSSYGLFNYAIAYAAIFSILAALGMDSIVIREIVRRPEEKTAILGTAFSLKFAGAMLMLAAAGLIQLWMLPGQGQSRPVILVIVAGLLFQPFDTIDCWFQSQVRSSFVVCARNAAFAVASLLKITMILLHYPLLAFAWVTLAENVLAAIGLLVAYRWQGLSIRAWQFRWDSARDLLRSSWPLLLVSMGIWVYMRIDQVMLGVMLDEHAVGVYSVAVRLSEVWYFIPMAVASSVFPWVASAKDSNSELFLGRMQQLFNFMAAMGFAFALPMTFLSTWVVRILYGPSYDGAGPMLAVLAWAGLFVGLGVARDAWFISEGRSRFLLVATLLGAACNVVINWIYIPAYGGMAASVATVVSQFLSVSFCTLLYSRTRKVFAMQMKSLVLWGGFCHN